MREVNNNQECLSLKLIYMTFPSDNHFCFNIKNTIHISKLKRESVSVLICKKIKNIFM